jgi:hypothetical protein
MPKYVRGVERYSSSSESLARTLEDNHDDERSDARWSPYSLVPSAKRVMLGGHEGPTCDEASDRPGQNLGASSSGTKGRARQDFVNGSRSSGAPRVRSAACSSKPARAVLRRRSMRVRAKIGFPILPLASGSRVDRTPSRRSPTGSSSTLRLSVGPSETSRRSVPLRGSERQSSRRMRRRLGRKGRGRSRAALTGPRAKTRPNDGSVLPAPREIGVAFARSLG